MIRLAQLSKTFQGRPALQSLSLEIGQGEIFGLLGHNGAGKSTTFGLILGQIFPDTGEAFIGGISVQENTLQRSRASAQFLKPRLFTTISAAGVICRFSPATLDGWRQERCARW